MITSGEPPKVVVFGAALDTGNLGVQALGLSILSALEARLPNGRFVVFAGSPGRVQRRLKFPTDHGTRIVAFQEIGCSLSRNPWKSGNLYVETAMRQLRPGSKGGAIARELNEADLILDISGGDSFTSIYGSYRFRYVSLPKRFAGRFDTPIVYLPQTYGPFEGNSRYAVRELMALASQVWARDRHSQRIAQHYLGERPVMLAPDVAFTLPYDRDDGTKRRSLDGLVCGMNVSGLLANRKTAGRRFGLGCDYNRLMRDIATALLDADQRVRILLAPHVLVPESHAESDVRACRTLRESLSPDLRSRTELITERLDAMRFKSIISQCDFFVGSRMHACIAALSTGVPTCAIAYSDKTHGVFETVGAEMSVFDPRHQPATQIVRGVWDRFSDRTASRSVLEHRLPIAVRKVQEMFDGALAAMKRPSVRMAA